MHAMALKVNVGGKYRTLKLPTTAIAKGMKRSRPTIARFLKGLTHKKGSRRGRKRASTPEQDAHAAGVRYNLRKKNRGKRLTAVEDVKAEAGFPGSESTLRRRWRGEADPVVKRPARTRITFYPGDEEKRLAWAHEHAGVDDGWWRADPPDGPVYCDCKQFKAYLTPVQRQFARSRLVTWHYRTKREGVHEDCTRPGLKHTPGRAGAANVFCGVAGGRIITWKTYKKWNGRQAAACMGQLKKDLQAAFPRVSSFDVVHDCDPTGFRSHKCQRAQKRLGLRPKLLARRTPECMPLDITLWNQIEKFMRAEEDSWQGGAEPFPDGPTKGRGQRRMNAWLQRLERTARGLSEDSVRRSCGVVADRCREIIASDGKHIAEGRKRKRTEIETNGRRAGKMAKGATSAAKKRRGPTEPEARKRPASPEEPYLERQAQRLCGKHALNGAVGGPIFNEQDLRDGAQRAATEQQVPLKHHARKRGDFSESAIAHTLLHTSPYRLNATKRVTNAAEAFAPGPAADSVVGLLVHKPDHWIALRKFRNCIYLLDSTLQRPRVLTPRAFAAHLVRYPETYQIYTQRG